MAIVLIRHGETALNRARIVQPQDTPLSETGLEQARAVAERLANRGGVGRVISSDLARASCTAEAVAVRVGLPVEHHHLLRERDFGQLCGTPYDEIKDNLFAEDFAPPGGETWATFFARAAAAFALIAQTAQDVRGDLMVVTHGLMCHALIGRHAQLMRGEALPGYWFNAGITIFEATPPHAVSLLNCGEHLGYPRVGVSGI